jgi:hypothetical protein
MLRKIKGQYFELEEGRSDKKAEMMVICLTWMTLGLGAGLIIAYLITVLSA